MKKVIRFRTKHLAVTRPGQTVQVFIRHSAGKMDLTLTTPLEINVAIAVQKSKRSVEAE